MRFDPWTLPLALFVVAWLSGLWPVWQHWSQRALHRLVAFSAGTFAGSLIHVCLDLLGGHSHVPGEVHGGAGHPGAGDHAGHDHAGHDHAGHDHAGHDHAGHAHAAHEHVGHAHTALERSSAAAASQGEGGLAGAGEPSAAWAAGPAGGEGGGGEPLSASAAESAWLSAPGDDPSFLGLWSALLGGLLCLALVDRWLKRRALGHAGHADDDERSEHPEPAEAAPAAGSPTASQARAGQHQWVWRASYIGLSIHSILAGLGLGGLGLAPENPVWTGFVLAFLAHQAVETFSMGTLMRLAELPRRRASLLLLPFAAVAPVSFVLGHAAALHLGDLAPYAAAFSAGTFLFVTLFELLPESFHDRRGRPVQAALIALGAAVALGLPELAAHRPELFGQIASASWAVFLEMAPFLLFGFAIAGLISTTLRPERLQPLLSGEGPRPVALAALVGAPLPLCSCSVVPVAAALRQAGAGRGPTSAFLISTPETGVDSIAATYALLGPWMAFARPLAALATALATGLAVGAGERREQRRLAAAAPAAPAAKRPFGPGFPSLAPPAAEADCCHSAPPQAAPESCCAEHPEPAKGGGRSASGVAQGAPARWQAALHYGFVRLVDDLAWPLVFGVLASGLIAALLPSEWLVSPALHGPLGYLVMLAVGLPIYVCAAASTPVAATLIAKGLSPGAALVFLLASPATNLGSLLVVKRLLGGRGLAIHLLVLSLTTLAAGFALDLLLSAAQVDLRAPLVETSHQHSGPLALVSAAVLAGLLCASFYRGLSRAPSPDASSPEGLSRAQPAA